MFHLRGGTGYRHLVSSVPHEYRSSLFFFTYEPLKILILKFRRLGDDLPFTERDGANRG